jgi:hypothetical protein
LKVASGEPVVVKYEARSTFRSSYMLRNGCPCIKVNTDAGGKDNLGRWGVSAIGAFRKQHEDEKQNLHLLIRLVLVTYP